MEPEKDKSASIAFLQAFGFTHFSGTCGNCSHVTRTSFVLLQARNKKQATLGELSEGVSCPRCHLPIPPDSFRACRADGRSGAEPVMPTTREETSEPSNNP